MRKSLGFSLIEVMIAVVILALVGTVTLNGLLNGRANSDKISVNSLTFAQIDSAAQTLTAAPYRACSTSQTNPYLSETLPSRVSVVSVEGLTRAGDWISCGNASWATQSSVIQRVKIEAPYTNKPDGSPYTRADAASAKYVTRTILKTFPALTYASNYSVKIVRPDNGQETANYDVVMGPIPGPTATSDSFTLRVENNASSCFQILPSDYTTSETLNPTITNPCPGLSGGTSSVRVRLPGASSLGTAVIKPGTYSVDIGAFNSSTGDFAKPASLRVIVKPSLQVTMEIQNVSGTTTTPGTSCNAFKNTKTTATIAYCLVKLRIVPGTGTGQGIAVVPLVTPGCSARAYSTGTTNTYVRCSFPTFPTQLTQQVWGSETDPVQIYLWRESLTSTTDQIKANNFCSGNNTSTYNQATTITLSVYDKGFEDTLASYQRVFSPPPIKVVCL